ncbi:MAG: hypothetical protein ABII09_04030 [Planctomycetota bacterium]
MQASFHASFIIAHSDTIATRLLPELAENKKGLTRIARIFRGF